MSNTTALCCCVPQGSVLVCILCAMYMLPLRDIIGKFKDISYHCYAEDVQLYCMSLSNLMRFVILYNCLMVVRDQMAGNFLHLNSDKTEILGSDCLFSKLAQLLFAVFHCTV